MSHLEREPSRHSRADWGGLDTRFGTPSTCSERSWRVISRISHHFSGHFRASLRDNQHGVAVLAGLGRQGWSGSAHRRADSWELLGGIHPSGWVGFSPHPGETLILRNINENSSVGLSPVTSSGFLVNRVYRSFLHCS